MANKTLSKEIKSWIGIIIGCMLSAVGFVFFINPYSIIPGGVYGLSIICHNLVTSVQVGTFSYCFEIPLLILAFCFLGKKLGVKTVTISLITPMMMNVLTTLVYPNEAALQQLDPSQLLGGTLDLSDQLIVASLIGPLLFGIGSGLVVRCGATSGGTDIVAMLMHKYMKMRYSNALLLADGAVVLLGLIVNTIMIGGGSVLLSIYSLIAAFIGAKVVAYTISGPQNDKIIWVITNHAAMPELRRFIIEDLEHTATIIRTEGLYRQNEMPMLMLIVNYKKVQVMKSRLKEFDPTAFVIISDACDAYGEGWKTLPNVGDLQPE